MSQPRRRVSAAFVVGAGVAILCLTQVASSQAGPFGPIHVAANRTQYEGTCPIDVVYTGTIGLTMPHPHGLTFNYHWERSDHAKRAIQVVRPTDSQRSVVVRETWRLGVAGQTYKASVTLFVNSGNAHGLQASPVVKVVCR